MDKNRLKTPSTVLAALLLVPALYVLSTAPAGKLMDSGVVPRRVLEIVYYPLNKFTTTAADFMTLFDSALAAVVVIPGAAVVMCVAGHLFPNRRVVRRLILDGFLCSLLGGYATAYLSGKRTMWSPSHILRTFPQQWQCRFFFQGARVEAEATQAVVHLRRHGADQEKPSYSVGPSRDAGILNWIELILRVVGSTALVGVSVILATLFVRRVRTGPKCSSPAAEVETGTQLVSTRKGRTTAVHPSR